MMLQMMVRKMLLFKKKHFPQIEAHLNASVREEVRDSSLDLLYWEIHHILLCAENRRKLHIATPHPQIRHICTALPYEDMASLEACVAFKKGKL